MGIINRPLWAILGVLVLGLAISVSGVFYFRGEARTLRTELNATQRDLKGLESAMAEVKAEQTRKRVLDAKQSDVRADKAKAVRAVRAEIQKEGRNANDSHLASTAELGRLRRLVEAGNAGIRSSRELP